MKRITTLFACLLLTITATVTVAHGEDEFRPTIESLRQHECPEWFRDAKFGIYLHWGAYSVVERGEWYARKLYEEGGEDYQYHLEHFGHPSEFGYHDFVPLFTAEKFDPEEWAELFEQTGARFAGPVAEHHDGFSMWDSDVTPWNAMDKGPRRDITGELAAALRERGMRLITTFHHARNLQRYRSTDEKAGRLSHYPFYDNMPPSSDDPELRLLYGNLPEELAEESLGAFVKLGDQLGDFFRAYLLLEFQHDGIDGEHIEGIGHCHDQSAILLFGDRHQTEALGNGLGQQPRDVGVDLRDVFQAHVFDRQMFGQRRREHGVVDDLEPQ